MSQAIWRIVLALVLGAHGIGHVVFLVSTLGVADWGGPSHSWLLANLGGGTVERVAGSLLWMVALAGFLAAAAGLLAQHEWWRTAAVVSAGVSLLGLAIFWSNPPGSSVFSAAILDVAVLVALLAVHWPSASLVGS
jgi:hypothetical protein